MSKWFILLYALFCFSEFSYASFYKEYSLEEGETIVVKIPTESGLKLPRRKVVDLQYIDHDEWRIIALKPGNITLRPIDKEEQDDIAVLVKVRKAQKVLPPSKKGFVPKKVFKMQLFLQKHSFSEGSSHGINPEVYEWDVENLSSKQTFNSGEIMSQTSVDIRQGYKARIQDGGEFLVQYDSSQKEEEIRGWKSYGMQGDVFLESAYDSYGLLRFSIKLVSQQQGSSTLQRHSFTGATKMPFMKLRCLGSSFLNSSSDYDATNYYLSGIPIIGPIFQLIQEQAVKTQVFLWARILAG